jgi:hypothetical protein
LNAERLLAALALPEDCRVGHRVPKKLLAENASFGAGDRKAVAEGVEELTWVAACKPGNLGVPAFRDEAREYLEIAVLHLRARGEPERLSTLLHRAVPYPAVLITEWHGGVAVSLVHKRASKGERDRVVLDGDVVSVSWTQAEEMTDDRFSALAWRRLPSMFALYQAWLDALHALRAARITGRFALPTSDHAANMRREALLAREAVLAELARKTAEAERESQMARLVALNEEIRQLRARLIEEESRL